MVQIFARSTAMNNSGNPTTATSVLPTPPCSAIGEERRISGISSVFAYDSSLQSNEFRLLELFPPTEQSPNTVNGQLLRVNSDNTLPFTAISYTWSTDSCTGIVWIDGQLFEVNKNVKNLLLELRPSAAGGSRRLWIDMICINQKDTQERNAQIKLMRQIYQCASQVLAWLDQPMDGHDRLAQATQILENAASNRHDIAEPSTDQIAAVQWLVCHRYWSRQWIIQELALAERVDLISYGYQVPLSSLHTPLSIGYDHLQICFQSPLASILSRCGTIKIGHILELMNESVNPNACIKDLLVKYKDNQCSDPRDKVFALLSLCPASRGRINADYTLSAVALLVRVVNYCLQNEHIKPRELMGHALLVYTQLQITVEDVRSYLNNHLTGPISSNKTPYTGAAVARGQFTVSRISPEWERYVLSCRDILSQQLPSLRSHFSPYGEKLIRCLFPSEGLFCLPGSELGLRGIPLVGVYDLYAFEFKCRWKYSSPHVALATTRPKLNDEVWHFAKTPVAMLVRRFEGGQYSIIGRTYVLRRHGPLGYCGLDARSLPLDSLLDCAEELDCEDLSTENIRELHLDVSALLAVLSMTGGG